MITHKVVYLGKACGFYDDKTGYIPQRVFLSKDTFDKYPGMGVDRASNKVVLPDGTLVNKLPTLNLSLVGSGKGEVVGEDFVMSAYAKEQYDALQPKEPITKENIEKFYKTLGEGFAVKEKLEQLVTNRAQLLEFIKMTDKSSIYSFAPLNAFCSNKALFTWEELMELDYDIRVQLFARHQLSYRQYLRLLPILGLPSTATYEEFCKAYFSWGFTGLQAEGAIGVSLSTEVEVLDRPSYSYLNNLKELPVDIRAKGYTPSNAGFIKSIEENQIVPVYAHNPGLKRKGLVLIMDNTSRMIQETIHGFSFQDLTLPDPEGPITAPVFSFNYEGVPISSDLLNNQEAILEELKYEALLGKYLDKTEVKGDYTSFKSALLNSVGFTGMIQTVGEPIAPEARTKGDEDFSEEELDLLGEQTEANFIDINGNVLKNEAVTMINNYSLYRDNISPVLLRRRITTGVPSDIFSYSSFVSTMFYSPNDRDVNVEEHINRAFEGTEISDNLSYGKALDEGIDRMAFRAYFEAAIKEFGYTFEEVAEEFDNSGNSVVIVFRDKKNPSRFFNFPCSKRDGLKNHFVEELIESRKKSAMKSLYWTRVDSVIRAAEMDDCEQTAHAAIYCTTLNRVGCQSVILDIANNALEQDPTLSQEELLMAIANFVMNSVDLEERPEVFEYNGCSVGISKEDWTTVANNIRREKGMIYQFIENNYNPLDDSPIRLFTNAIVMPDLVVPRGNDTLRVCDFWSMIAKEGSAQYEDYKEKKSLPLGEKSNLEGEYGEPILAKTINKVYGLDVYVNAVVSLVKEKKRPLYTPYELMKFVNPANFIDEKVYPEINPERKPKFRYAKTMTREEILAEAPTYEYFFTYEPKEFKETRCAVPLHKETLEFISSLSSPLIESRYPDQHERIRIKTEVQGNPITEEGYLITDDENILNNLNFKAISPAEVITKDKHYAIFGDSFIEDANGILWHLRV